MSAPPPDFDSWEQCRDYYALEALFLGQLMDRKPSKRNQRRYKEAARKAFEANRRCAEPFPEESTSVREEKE